jgi:hypothetical protein
MLNPASDGVNRCPADRRSAVRQRHREGVAHRDGRFRLTFLGRVTIRRTNKLTCPAARPAADITAE